MTYEKVVPKSKPMTILACAMFAATDRATRVERPSLSLGCLRQAVGKLWLPSW